MKLCLRSIQKVNKEFDTISEILDNSFKLIDSEIETILGISFCQKKENKKSKISTNKNCKLTAAPWNFRHVEPSIYMGFLGQGKRSLKNKAIPIKRELVGQPNGKIG